jgi:hypothetical protein
MYQWQHPVEADRKPSPEQPSSTGCYFESDAQTQSRERAFTYHAPTVTQIPRFALIRSEANRLAQVLNTNCPPSRELSLALTHLDQVVMFGNAAIARNESPA